MIIKAPKILDKISKYTMGMMLFPFIIVRHTPPTPFANLVINHEKIHFRQAWELFIVGFYIQYGIEFLINLIRYKNRHRAYRAVSFEQEAYANQYNFNYLQTREPYNWVQYIGRKLPEPKIYPILYYTKNKVYENISNSPKGSEYRLFEDYLQGYYKQDSRHTRHVARGDQHLNKISRSSDHVRSWDS